jgi:triosephosphate isomerase (TIM)
MRKKTVAGNWKMNLSKEEAIKLFGEIELRSEDVKDEVNLFVFPPSVYLDILLTARNTDSRIKIGAQNFYPADSGAFTGEVSIAQLKDLGVDAVIIGHSERREHFGESNEFLKRKVDAALNAGLIPIFCCGEPLTIRQSGQHDEYVKQQLEESLFHLDVTQFEKVIIAYEPIWAIGTGMTASAEQAEEMHSFIRSLVQLKYRQDAAHAITILYGGSCNASNAGDLFRMPNVDGGLIGGASLKAEEFLAIARTR